MCILFMWIWFASVLLRSLQIYEEIFINAKFSFFFPLLFFLFFLPFSPSFLFFFSVLGSNLVYPWQCCLGFGVFEAGHHSVVQTGLKLSYPLVSAF